MHDPEHWNRVYETKAPDAVSWYAPALTASLALIQGAHLPGGAQLIDVGGGASTLPRDLLALGLRPTVLDIAQAAIDAARAQVSDPDAVEWRVGDVTEISLPAARYHLWHDRAVFHFLTEPADRARYVAHLRHALRPGGHVVLATFALDGPERCSGLPVIRYDAAGLHGALGPGFELTADRAERHITPWGSVQPFQYIRARRVG